MLNRYFDHNLVQLPRTCLCDLVWTCGRCYVTHKRVTHGIIVVHRPADAPQAEEQEQP